MVVNIKTPLYMYLEIRNKKIKNLTTQRIMKTNEIKEQLNLMHNFMDADENLCGCAGIDYDYEKYLEDNYKIIAKRLNVSVEEVRRVDEEN